MKDISDLKIVGIDEARPPIIRKEPYIELYFKLIHQAPREWCQVFNECVAKSTYPISIKIDDGLFVETWVRKAEEVEAALKMIQVAIKTSIALYIETIEAKTRNLTSQSVGVEATGEQLELNKIIIGLDYD